MPQVSIVKCVDYTEKEVKRALREVLIPINGLNWVKSGMKIVIKANLVSFLKPEKAATTHPALLYELVNILREKGAVVIIGDSPGGLYNSIYVNRVYSATGMKTLEKAGAILNQNFSQSKAEFPEAKVLKSFEYTSYLAEADGIINFCKLKTHGMMGMSASAKNMFGAIPGTFKPEYHFKYPDPMDFANMIVDLNEYFKPVLNIADAVVGMEGNGPTMGTPRHIGALLASFCPHKMDLACAKLIGLTKEKVPTLLAAYDRGLIPATADELRISGNIDEFIIPDYKNIAVHSSIRFETEGNGIVGKTVSYVINKSMRSTPILKKSQCIGCNECGRICPAKAITMVKNKAVINRKKCICCFCCQEFCPKGAMKVKRPLVARIINKVK